MRVIVALIGAVAAPQPLCAQLSLLQPAGPEGPAGLVLEPGVSLLLQGDPVPEDGYFVSIAADAHRAGDLAALREEVRQCKIARDQAREQTATQFGTLTKDLNACETAKTRCDARLHETQTALDTCKATMPIPTPPPTIPAWGWVLAGGAAPLVGLGTCDLLNCTTQTSWLTASGTFLATLTLAYIIK